MERWLLILDAFAGRDEFGVRDLAAASGLSLTATHRICHEMARMELLSQVSPRGPFRVGPELARVAALITDRIDVRRVSRPVLEMTALSIGETVMLLIYSPLRQACCALDAAESPQTIRYLWESLRPWNDLLRGASGKGILAFLPDAERDAILAPLPAAERSLLQESLALARERGYVISHGERFAGAVGASAPIRDATGRIVGDLVAGWPNNRSDPEKEQAIAMAVMAGADEISTGLGYRKRPRV